MNDGDQLHAGFVRALMNIQAKPKFTTRYATRITNNVNINKRRYLRLGDKELLPVIMNKMVAF